jgi:hypothetical protein
MSFGCLPLEGVEGLVPAPMRKTDKYKCDMERELTNTYEEDSEYERNRIMLVDCPEEMNKDGVTNLCQKYGKFAMVSRKSTFFFENRRD